MPNGHIGKILHVDLNYAKLEIEEPIDALYRKFMDVSAMGRYCLLRDMYRVWTRFHR